jgi:uncharacterized protein (TIGR02611 family)
VSAGEDNRDDALARVLAYRERGRARAMPMRAALGLVGVVLLIASVPLIIVLPELGIPALLIALRLLAVEADWAARAYAWTDWRFTQMQNWFHRQSRAVRATIVIALLVVAAALVWWIVLEFV